MRLLLSLLCAVLLAACSESKKDPVSIAINPWPGYELLYLAEQKGFFEQEGVDVRLLQLGSLSDAQRAYLNGHADGMASTVIEAVQAQVLGARPLSIVMVPDYSSGGDVIIAADSVSSVEQLRGKPVGCEVSSLGIFILQRALAKAGMTLADVEVVNVEQSEGHKALSSGEIAAFVSYPPVSISILSQPGYQQIFSSAEIPHEIIDVVSLSNEVIAERPELVAGLYRAWDRALAYYRSNSDEAAEIMARRENISAADFQAVISDELVILDGEQQRRLIGDASILQKNVDQVCETLVQVAALDTDCSRLPAMIHQQTSP